MEKKTAKYKGKLVYVLYITENGAYALVSYNEDGTKAFKADVLYLTDLSFTIKYDKQ